MDRQPGMRQAPARGTRIHARLPHRAAAPQASRSTACCALAFGAVADGIELFRVDPALDVVALQALNGTLLANRGKLLF